MNAHIHTHTFSLTRIHTSDKPPSFSSRFQPVNLTHPASPHLAMPHGPYRGQGERFERDRNSMLRRILKRRGVEIKTEKQREGEKYRGKQRKLRGRGLQKESKLQRF